MKYPLIAGGAIAALAISTAITMIVLQLMWALMVFSILAAGYWALKSKAEALDTEQLKYKVKLYIYRLLSRSKSQ